MTSHSAWGFQKGEILNNPKPAWVYLYTNRGAQQCRAMQGPYPNLFPSLPLPSLLPSPPPASLISEGWLWCFPLSRDMYSAKMQVISTTDL